VAAFDEGVKTARYLYEVEIDQPGEIVISGVVIPRAGPYQASRAANVVAFGPKPVVVKGGVILIPADCKDGVAILVTARS